MTNAGLRGDNLLCIVADARLGNGTYRKWYLLHCSKALPTCLLFELLWGTLNRAATKSVVGCCGLIKLCCSNLTKYQLPLLHSQAPSPSSHVPLPTHFSAPPLHALPQLPRTKSTGGLGFSSLLDNAISLKAAPTNRTGWSVGASSVPVNKSAGGLLLLQALYTCIPITCLSTIHGCRVSISICSGCCSCCRCVVGYTAADKLNCIIQRMCCTHSSPQTHQHLLLLMQAAMTVDLLTCA